MVSEIRNDRDRLFCHFGQFFALLPPSPYLMIPKIKILKKKNEKNTWGDYPYIHAWVP